MCHCSFQALRSCGYRLPLCCGAPSSASSCLLRNGTRLRYRSAATAERSSYSSFSSARVVRFRFILVSAFGGRSLHGRWCTSPSLFPQFPGAFAVLSVSLSSFRFRVWWTLAALRVPSSRFFSLSSTLLQVLHGRGVGGDTLVRVSLVPSCGIP